MVALLKEFYGRGPTRAKSYCQDDLVSCVLRGGFSRVEETLLQGERGRSALSHLSPRR
ncbi:MAG TPA: Na-translocating system protein MpsC family protein [Solirubrobacteraceae bacterium]|nr:Na-translocating system protein MpsC family protein [Solirubrobacteraceae bacterium]